MGFLFHLIVALDNSLREQSIRLKVLKIKVNFKIKRIR
jgi:hypothetical protein